MEKIIAGALFLIIAAGVFVFITTAEPNQPCVDGAEDNCMYERQYGVNEE